MLSEMETFNMLMAIKNNGWTPDSTLSGTKKVLLKSEEDFNSLPKKNCVYWIVTDEPIKHSMSSPNSYKLPEKIKNVGEIIYNGVASNLNSRIKEHLFRTKCEGKSAISVDLYTLNDLYSRKNEPSHIKTAYKKTVKRNPNPFIVESKERIQSRHDLLKLNLSEDEKMFVKNNDSDKIYFWNGINILWDKHVNYNWFVYYYECESIVSNIIENQWRERFGKPKLCKYNGGR